MLIKKLEIKKGSYMENVDTVEQRDELIGLGIDIDAVELQETIDTLTKNAYELYNSSIPLLKSLILGREPTKTEEDGLGTKFLLAKIVAGRDPQKLESLSHERGQSKEEIVAGMRVELEDFYVRHKKEKGEKAQKTLEGYAHYVCNVGAGWKMTEGKFHMLGMNFRDKILEFIANKEFDKAIDMFDFTKTLKAVGETKEERVLDVLTKIKIKIDEG